jgi:hypothetical protein
MLPLLCSLSAEHLEHLEFPGTGVEQQTAPVCPVAVVKGHDTKLLLVDPFYYQYQGCMCLAGYTPAVAEENHTAVAMVCEQHPERQVGAHILSCCLVCCLQDST